ncbi:hypothetical protein [Thermanaeromonas toyohensis]|uniref:hypothetical protein n=1 Tax=Thermanaeromonas toyohensis TaxID=161154 RepID=UPI0012F4CC9E|nr:hypothetical protein [Thermanaeromonas toyohensis]
MQEKVMASFVVRIMYEAGNEQIPWRIIIHHVQSGTVYHLTGIDKIPSLFQQIVEKEKALAHNKVIPLDTRKI